MRLHILFPLLVGLCLVSPLHAQPKIGLMRTLDKSSPLLSLGLMQRVRVASGDVNGDGIPEIVTRRDGFIFEAYGYEKIEWTYDATGSGMSEPRFLGFARLMALTGAVTHAVFQDGVDVRFLRISDSTLDDFILKASEPPTEEVGFVFHTITLKSGRDVIAYRDGDKLHLIGATMSFTGGGGVSRKAAVTTAPYALDEKSSGAEGERLGYDPDLYPLDGGMDFDGDGADDLPVLASGPNGNPLGLVVYGGDSFDELWRWTFPIEYIERILMGFHGFADVDGDGVKELFCGDNLVAFRDGSVQELQENFRIRHLVDVDGDGLPDVIVRDLATNRILALGKATATDVDEMPLPAVAALHPAYPNPVFTGSTISFTLRNSAGVRLEIHDLLGRRVRTLRDAVLDAGTYRLDWDGSDAAGAALSPGAYSVVLTTAGAVLRQGIIITR